MNSPGLYISILYLFKIYLLIYIYLVYIYLYFAISLPTFDLFLWFSYEKRFPALVVELDECQPLFRLMELVP